jgi:hypothetical protein
LQRQGHDGEFEALCFFFTNYVNIPRECHTNLFLEALQPVFNASSPDSPLRHATTAVAVTISDFWRTLGPYSGNSRRSWARAVAATRSAIFDPELSRSDELLAAIFMLDFYQGLNRRYVNLHEDPDLHQKAAIALIRARGEDNVKTDSARRLYTSLRSKYIFSHLQARKRLRLDGALNLPIESGDWPTTKLDMVMLELANLLADIEDFSQKNLAFGALHADMIEMDDTTEAEAFLTRCFEIKAEMDSWRQSVPGSWEPCRIKDMETVHHSIRAVGLYNGLCDVYSSHTVAQMMNFWRTINITLLRVIKHLSWLVGPQFMLESAPTDAEIDDEIQKLADDICACVPFHVGSRTTFCYPYEPQNYPPVPGWLRETADYIDGLGNPTLLTDADHARSAAAAGGWFLLTPMTTLMEYSQPFPLTPGADERSTLEPIKLRPGQLRWITSQCRRIHKIYLIPWPYGTTSSTGMAGLSTLAPYWGFQEQGVASPESISVPIHEIIV